MYQTPLNQETLDSIKIYVDASAPEFVRSLKVMVGEDDNPTILKTTGKHLEKLFKTRNLMIND